MQVKRTNLVVANAVDLGADRLRTLVDRLGSNSGSQALRSRLFETLWDNLRYVGELGSLVQVRRRGHPRFSTIGSRPRRTPKASPGFFQPTVEEQLELGELRSEAERAHAEQLALERMALAEEAAGLRRELLAAVEAAAASVADDPADRLFAEDTARGLKLVQLLSRRYDVAVMNPPYGSFVPRVKDFVKASVSAHLQRHLCDVHLTALVSSLRPEGYVGALVSSTFTSLHELSRSSARRFC